MFFLLVKVRLKSGINLICKNWEASPWVTVGLSLLGIGLTLAVYLGFYALFQLAGSLNVLNETCFQIMAYLFLFLFAGSVPFVASSLLQAGDYNLLFSSPVQTKSIVAAKLLDATVTNSLQFSALGAPAILACAVALKVGPIGIALTPLLIVLFALLPALLTALALIGLLGMLGVKRIRSVISILNGLMAAFVCVTIVIEINQLPIKPSMEMFRTTFSATGVTSPLAHILPSSLFAEVLCNLNSHVHGSVALFALLKILAIVTLLFYACLAMGGRLLTAANLSEDIPRIGSFQLGSLFKATSGNNENKTRPILNSKSAETPLGNPLSTNIERGGAIPKSRGSSIAISGILKKDILYFWRDSVLLSQVAMPMILIVVPFILAFQAPELRKEISYFAALIVGVVLFMQTSILSLTSLGLESQAFWAILASPMGCKAALRGKFWFSWLISSGICLALTILTGLIFTTSPLFLATQVFFILICGASLCGMGVGLSAIFPRFVYENPAHRVSAWGLVLGFFAYFGYVTLSGGFFAIAWLIESNLNTNSNLKSGANPFTILIYLTATLAFLLFSAACGYIPFQIGVRRIEAYEWEH